VEFREVFFQQKEMRGQREKRKRPNDASELLNGNKKRFE
jgi:hypothetical protein